jgi:hypothetical protein
VRIPTFPRQSGTDTEEKPTTATTGTTPVRQRTDVPPGHGSDDTTKTDGRTVQARAEASAAAERAAANRDANVAAKPKIEDRKAEVRDERASAVAGPKPRASLLATLGLILGVASALLVLSGPLLGYGIGVAVLALILSLSGISATGRRHVAGRTDALIGMVLSLAAVVVGVLALTGSLSWLGTDMQPVHSLREWLDTQFVHRF